VVGTRTVTDAYGVNDRFTDGRFTFKEPAGTYVVSASSSNQTVVIRPGKTVRVALPDDCD
jgi:hypothetical protein